MNTPLSDKKDSASGESPVSALSALALVGQFGLVIVAPLVAGVLIGRLFGTLGVLIGVLLGLAAGIVGAYGLLWKTLPRNH